LMFAASECAFKVNDCLIGIPIGQLDVTKL
jgi:hypothetical protein